jgi:hypothetical protein
MLKKDKYRKQVELLWNQFGLRDRGAIVTWSEIYQAIDIKPYETGWHSIIRRFRRKLFVERDIVTYCKTAIGIRLLTDEEAAGEVPKYRHRKAYRQMNRGCKEASAVNVSHLNDHQSKVFAMQRTHLRDQRRKLGRIARIAEGKK